MGHLSRSTAASSSKTLPSFNEAGTKLVPERAKIKPPIHTDAGFNEAGTKLVPERPRPRRGPGALIPSMRPGPSWSRKGNTGSLSATLGAAFNEAGTKLVPERLVTSTLDSSTRTFNEAGTKLVPERMYHPPLIHAAMPLQ